MRLGMVWLAAMLACGIGAAENVWLEGEEAKSNDFVKHNWYDAVAKESFSGRQWLSHYDAAKPGTAKYEFESKEGGEFVFWLRCNYFACEMDYQLNAPDWKPIDCREKNLRDGLMVSAKPDHRFIGWVKVGKVTLAKGANALAIKIHSKLANHGGIDCMVFSNTGFIPAGATKPGAEDVGESGAPDPDCIWVEGENPEFTDFKKHGWYDKVAKEGFSGKEWLSHYDAAAPGIARYSFDVKKTGDFAFWVRCNYFACEMDYQLDTADAKPGGWKPIDFSEKNLRDTMMVSDKPDHRFIGWVKAGTVNLTAGKHTVVFKIHSKLANHGGIDCFCFANSSFVPSGATKPTVASAVSKPDAWFRVNAEIDAFSDKSITDMSSLLPKPAGKFGFLKRDSANLKFEKGDAPVKFWGVCASAEEKNTPEDMTLRCKYFAKNGINMVRQHPIFGFLGPMKNGQFDAKKMDQWDRWFAELKKQGVYMTWSVFYPLRISADDGYPPELLAELEKGGDGLYSTMGLVNISRQLQDLELRYVKALLAHVNPYTTLAYKDDPALAVLEIHNEDCVFFHNPLTGLAAGKPPKHAQMLRKMFCEWAKKKYGTDEALKKAWGMGDSLASGEISLFATWQMTPQRPQVNSKAKLGDEIRFLTELQRDYYVRRVKEMRDDCGFKAVTVTTAWWTEAIASPANLYCDAAADMIDRHNYFGGGEGAHAIKVGKVNNGTHLAQPGSGILSSGFFQTEDQPFCMTEWTQSPPNQWKVEMAPLFAFYGMGLQGWDSSYHFACNGPRIGDGWPGLSWYCTDTPHYVGQFPALAFALYKGHIKEAPLAAARRLKLDDLFTGEDALQQGGTAGGGTGADFKTAVGTKTPNEVLAIGRVTVSFDGKASECAEWTKYWDKDKKVVRSMTDELVWDYNRRVVTLQAPKTQAIVGFAGGADYDLPGAKVNVTTPFCSIIFTPLDDKPLAESKHILITAMGKDKQSNSQYNADGTQLLAIGGPPLLLEPVQATITLKGAPPAEISVVDIYGVPTDKKVKATGAAFTIDGTYKTYYYEVKR
jgi:hypothetical protein